jgi:hypothetical protein
MNDFTHKYGKPDVHFDTSSMKIGELAKNRNLDSRPDLLERLVDGAAKSDLSPRQTLNVLRNPSFTKTHYDKIFDAQLSKSDSVIHGELGLSKHIDSHQIDKLLDKADETSDPSIYSIVAESPKTEPKHIKRLMDLNFSGIDEVVAARKDLHPEHINRLWDTKDTYVRQKLMIHQKELPSPIIHDIIDGTRMQNQGMIATTTLKKVLGQKNLDQTHINKLLNHSNPDIPYLTKHHLSGGEL